MAGDFKELVGTDICTTHMIDQTSYKNRSYLVKSTKVNEFSNLPHELTTIADFVVLREVFVLSPNIYVGIKLTEFYPNVGRTHYRLWYKYSSNPSGWHNWITKIKA